MTTSIFDDIKYMRFMTELKRNNPMTIYIMVIILLFLVILMNLMMFTEIMMTNMLSIARTIIAKPPKVEEVSKGMKANAELRQIRNKIK